MQSRADQNLRARAVVDDGDGVSAAPSWFQVPDSMALPGPDFLSDVCCISQAAFDV